MWDTNGWKYKHIFYNLNWVRKKSWKKYQKAVEWYVLILKKQEKDWESKWVQKTKEKSLARLVKYWISMDKVKETLKSKWLDSLVKYC